MSTQTRRIRQRDENRTEILEAAREIFLTDGYEGFSMRKLAVRVGCSAGALYLHFRDKESLFDVLVEQSFEQLHQALTRLRDARGRDPAGTLKQGLREYVEWGLAHPNEYAIAFLLCRPATSNPYRTHAAFDVARSLVRACLGRRARPAQVELATQAVWAATHGITSLLIERPAFPWAAKKTLIACVIGSAVDGAIHGGPKHRGGSHGQRGVR
jgi:AcrR family transcriptional regulator